MSLATNRMLDASKSEQVTRQQQEDLCKLSTCRKGGTQVARVVNSSKKSTMEKTRNALKSHMVTTRKPYIVGQFPIEKGSPLAEKATFGLVSQNNPK